MSSSRRTRWLLALASVALLAGCREVTINRLMSEPQRYHDDEVGLKGEVVESFSVMGKGAYQLDDGTGRIWIISEHGVPRRGARVAVRGYLRDVVDLGGLVQLPSQVGSGLVLKETEHRAR
jgi:hypothetical protein